VAAQLKSRADYTQRVVTNARFDLLLRISTAVSAEGVEVGICALLKPMHAVSGIGSFPA
jgi:hypothetical protein